MQAFYVKLQLGVHLVSNEEVVAFNSDHHRHVSLEHSENIHRTRVPTKDESGVNINHTAGTLAVTDDKGWSLAILSCDCL